jgi:hypothetical protein
MQSANFHKYKMSWFEFVETKTTGDLDGAKAIGQTKLNIANYYIQMIGEIDLRTDSYALSKANDKDDDEEFKKVDLAEVESIRTKMIARLNCLIREQLEWIEKSFDGQPMQRYCYLLEETDTPQLDLKLIISNMQISKEAFLFVINS